MKLYVKKSLIAVGLVVAFIVIAVVVALGYYFVNKSIAINSAREKIGAPAGTLQVDGLAFRDLNKNGRLDPYEDRRQPVAVRVDDLLAQMTSEEKAGLLFHAPSAVGKNGELAGLLEPMDLLPMEVALFSKNMHFFNLFMVDGAVDLARWQNRVQQLAERTRLGIPVAISTDPRHGPKIKNVAGFYMPEFFHVPEPIGFAALRNPDLAYEFGQRAAQEYRAVGIHIALHPMADLATEPRWARISGTFGEDAELSARLTAAYIRGFQGDTLGPTSVATTVKHFAGGGPQEDGWDPHFRYGKNQVYPGHNFDYHLIPFRAAFAAGTSLVMPYYGVPVGLTSEDVGFNFNREIVTDLMRDKMGYNGIALTDWGVVTPVEILGVSLERFFPFGGVKDYGVEALTPAHRAGKALDAGIDQFGGEWHPEYVMQLLDEGKLKAARLDDSVRKLLALLFELGLFDNPYVDVDAVAQRLGTEASRRFGDDLQRRSQVLLTNKVINGKTLLPLANGLRIYVQDMEVDVASRYGTVVPTIEEADVAIVKLEQPYDHERGTLIRQGRLYYTPEELAPVLKIARQKPTVITVYLERPLVIPELVEAAGAIVANFGVEETAIFDVLFGRAQPEGQLPFDMPSTWESVLKQKPDVPFDAENPLFKFGHGLRYEAVSSAPAAAP